MRFNSNLNNVPFCLSVNLNSTLKKKNQTWQFGLLENREHAKNTKYM